MRKLKIIGALLAISILLTACLDGRAKPNFQAFTHEITEDYVLVVYNIKKEEFDEVKDKSRDELMDLGHSIIELSYSGEKDFVEGDQISVWIDGEIEDSYPQRGKASKLELYIE